MALVSPGSSLSVDWTVSEMGLLLGTSKAARWERAEVISWVWKRASMAAVPRYGAKRGWPLMIGGQITRCRGKVFFASPVEAQQLSCLTFRSKKAISAVRELSTTFPLKNVHAHQDRSEQAVIDEDISGFVSSSGPTTSEDSETPDPSDHLSRLRARFRMAASLIGTSTAELLGTGKGGLNF